MFNGNRQRRPRGGVIAAAIATIGLTAGVSAAAAAGAPGARAAEPGGIPGLLPLPSLLPLPGPPGPPSPSASPSPSGTPTPSGTPSPAGTPSSPATPSPAGTPSPSAASGLPGLGGLLPISGIATHYAQTPQGNCSYPSWPSDGLYVALSPSEYDNGAACGEYLDVRGPTGSTVRVEVVDQCPECGRHHIDMSETAFSRLDPLPLGIIPVSYQVVKNPSLDAPLAMRVKEGSSASWLALLPMNTGNAVASVQVQNAQGGWDSLTQSGYGYWIAQQGEGPGPFTVRVTDTQGHTATLTGITLSPGQLQNSGTWMYGDATMPVAGS